MKTIITVLMAGLFLTGCPATVPVNQKPTDPTFVGTQVQVPVREKCNVTVPPEPVWAVEAVAPDATAFEKSKAVLAELEAHRDYEQQLLAATKKCE